MASWAIHFRVADWFLNKIQTLDKEYFLIGNIAPDCGVPVEGKREYDPPSIVTHRTNDGNKSDCDYNSIYNEFIRDETDVRKKSFFTGYFVHYMTDCLLALETCIPIEKAFGSFDTNRKLAKAVKKEWYNLDFTFFKNHISPSFELFKTYKAFHEPYPEFYKNNEISKQMKNIVFFYASNKPVRMKYKYTTPQIVEKFVEQTPRIIFDEIEKRDIKL